MWSPAEDRSLAVAPPGDTSAPTAPGEAWAVAGPGDASAAMSATDDPEPRRPGSGSSTASSGCSDFNCFADLDAAGVPILAEAARIGVGGRGGDASGANRGEGFEGPLFGARGPARSECVAFEQAGVAPAHVQHLAFYTDVEPARRTDAEDALRCQRIERGLQQVGVW